MKARLALAAALAAGAAFTTAPAQAAVPPPCQLGVVSDPWPSDPHSITYHYISYATCSTPNWLCPVAVLGGPGPSDPHSITAYYLGYVLCEVE